MIAALLPARYRGRVLPVLRCRHDETVAHPARGVIVASPLTLEHILRASPVVLSTSEADEVAACLGSTLEAFPIELTQERKRWGRRTGQVGSVANGAVVVGSWLFAPELAGLLGN